MIYITTSTSRIRALLVRWTIPACLSLACHVLILHQLSLSDLSEKIQAHEDSPELQLLDDRVAALEQTDNVAQQAPQLVTQTEFYQLSETFNRRLDGLHKTIAATATNADLHPLQLKVQALEAKLEQPVVSPAPSKPKLKPRKALQPAVLPFQIIGRELRGGEYFLSIAPIDAQSIGQSQVLRIGETHNGWKLDRLDDKSAVFLVNGEARRLNIR
ncbi:hypothetical protein [Pseudomonas synxantha]|uniref:Uncharacterized protein n=1 Tax=Pseudomonas synxantha TaxID=47883 RepID=A0ACC6JVQ0_9PSED|nr:hypothetical protein [Pseudomonas synxantha]MDR6610549.1 hypothetical protein [Pseudomonas synxantha]